MSDLLITRGIPGSGKTTWALAWVDEDPVGRVRVNRDDLRQVLYGRGFPLHEDGAVAYKREMAISVAQQEAVRALLRDGRSVIVDDTHIRGRYVRQWEEIAAGEGAEFTVVDHFAHEPVDVCIARDAARDRTVGEAAIRSLAERLKNALKAERKTALEELPPPRKYEPDVTLPACWIVDIDGTLAHTVNRSPYDYTRVGEDAVDPGVVALVHDLWKAGNDIVVVSGRDAACREDTLAWLEKALGWKPPLFMRAEGDRRNDAVIKEEIFWEHIAPRWWVQGVLDDRNRVVRMWRSLGLLCCQVADGAF